MTEYDSLVPPSPEAHSNSCITLNVVICLPCILLPNQFHFFFFFPLSCLELGFITYEKRTLFHLPEEDSFFSWVRIYSFFFKYHHTIYGKEGKPSGLVKEYVMKFKRHMHPSEKNIGA